MTDRILCQMQFDESWHLMQAQVRFKRPWPKRNTITYDKLYQSFDAIAARYVEPNLVICKSKQHAQMLHDAYGQAHNPQLGIHLGKVRHWPTGTNAADILGNFGSQPAPRPPLAHYPT